LPPTQVNSPCSGIFDHSALFRGRS
jgi:hypothetical protein